MTEHQIAAYKAQVTQDLFQAIHANHPALLAWHMGELAAIERLSGGINCDRKVQGLTEQLYRLSQAGKNLTQYRLVTV